MYIFNFISHPISSHSLSQSLYFHLFALKQIFTKKFLTMDENALIDFVIFVDLLA